MSYTEEWSRMYEEGYQAQKEQVMTPTEQISMIMNKYVEACLKIKELEVENIGLRKEIHLLNINIDKKSFLKSNLKEGIERFIEVCDDCGLVDHSDEY